MRLIQIRGNDRRRVGVVEGERVQLLGGPESVSALANAALSRGIGLSELIERQRTGEFVDYNDLYDGRSGWRLLPSADHPGEPARCMVTGTGLTHMASASRRDAMHAAAQQVTDSMRMYQWGVEGGKPVPGAVGAAPEWFYKGDGGILRAHNEPLVVPPFAEDGGEEPEIAGVYIIGPEGTPRRIGMTVGNEFSDHQFEKRNYLYLAASKLRTCSIGPELVVDPDFTLVEGTVAIERGGEILWSSPIRSGESAMCHSLANLEHHHFKFPQHRRPGDVHVHFFGADAFSFGSGIRLEDGDVMKVQFAGFGRALRNPIRIEPGAGAIVAVSQL